MARTVRRSTPAPASARGRGVLVAAVAVAAAAGIAVGRTGSAGSAAGLPPERVADYLHAVIDADRTTYTTQVVNRLQLEDKVITASEHFKEDKALPLPAQMLRMAAQRVGERGAFRYSLISDAAINKANLPKNEFEREGVAAVRTDPATPYRRTMEAGGRRYFLSLYPDRAVVQACVMCHNKHPHSPRRDWKVGDIMGAVVVALPVD